MIAHEAQSRPGESRATLASVPRRIAAFGADYLVVALYVVVLTLVSLAVGAGGGVEMDRAFADPVRGQVLGFTLLTLPVLLYFAVGEGSVRQATPGKRLLGIKVVASSGGRLPWSRSLLRSGLKFLPWELAHTCLWHIPGWPAAVEGIPPRIVAGLVVVWLLVALYLLMPITSRSRQAPYDRLARSLVMATGR